MRDFYFIDKNTGFLNLFGGGLRLNEMLLLSPLYFLVLLLLIPLALSGFLASKDFDDDDFDDDDFADNFLLDNELNDDDFADDFDDDSDTDVVFFFPLNLICIRLPKSFKSEYNEFILIGSCLGLYK
jgi:hypothetical protein